MPTADWEGLRRSLEHGVEAPPLDALRTRRRHRQERRAIAATFAVVMVGSAAGVAMLGQRAQRERPPVALPVLRDIDGVAKGDGLARVDHETYVVTDVDFVDASVGWAIGLRCRGAQCDIATWRTADGGTTWEAPASVARGVSRLSFREEDASGGGARSLRMVDARNGFAFNPDLYVTADGGTTWRRVPQPTKVAYVQVHGGSAWLVERGCAIGVDCDAVVRTGAVGAGFAPADLRVPPTGGAKTVLRRESADVAYLLTYDAPVGPPALHRTADGGVTWTAVTNPCAADTELASLSAGAGRPLWLACTSDIDEAAHASAKAVYTSANGGRTWERRADLPTPGVLTDLVALSADRAYATTNVPAQLLVTGDGGATWRPATGASTKGYGYANLDVVDARHAWAMGDENVLWRTTDGETWERLALPATAGTAPRR